MSFTRYAVYHLPENPDLAAFGSSWLGWDVARGVETAQPDLEGLRHVTEAPRKYGFHATLKPPFRLAEGCDPALLQEAVAHLAAHTTPTACDGLALMRLGRFLALVPEGDTSGIDRIASAAVEGLDTLRAHPGEAEIEKRRRPGLTRRQEALLSRWGYPYVMEEFRFHLTLSGRLEEPTIGPWLSCIASIMPDMPEPFAVTTISLVGARVEDGRFQKIEDYVLTG